MSSEPCLYLRTCLAVDLYPGITCDECFRDHGGCRYKREERQMAELQKKGRKINEL